MKLTRSLRADDSLKLRLARLRSLGEQFVLASKSLEHAHDKIQPSPDGGDVERSYCWTQRAKVAR
jgi:hypothetical protein